MFRRITFGSQSVLGVGTRPASWAGEESETRQGAEASFERRAAGRSYQHRRGDRVIVHKGECA